MKVIKYMKYIINTVISICVGMTITIKYLLKRPVTIQYPEQKRDISDRYRGLLNMHFEKCIACLQCANICPIECIKIESKKFGKKKKPVVFDIDCSRCMFCGLCVDVCPTKALAFTVDYEIAKYSHKELIYHWVTAEDIKRAEDMLSGEDRNKDDSKNK